MCGCHWMEDKFINSPCSALSLMQSGSQYVMNLGISIWTWLLKTLNMLGGTTRLSNKLKSVHRTGYQMAESVHFKFWCQAGKTGHSFLQRHHTSSWMRMLLRNTFRKYHTAFFGTHCFLLVMPVFLIIRNLHWHITVLLQILQKQGRNNGFKWPTIAVKYVWCWGSETTASITSVAL